MHIIYATAPRDPPFQSGNPMLRPAIVGHVHLFAQAQALRRHVGTSPFTGFGWA